MTLSQCSKADLLWVIEYLTTGPCKPQVSRALDALAYHKAMTALREADSCAEVAHAKRAQYIDLLTPYTGMSLADIPLDILDRAAKLLGEAETADKEYERLMQLVDK